MKLKFLIIFGIILLFSFSFISAISCCKDTCASGPKWLVRQDCSPEGFVEGRSCDELDCGSPICCKINEAFTCSPRVSENFCTSQGGEIIRTQDGSCESIDGCQQGCCTEGFEAFLSYEDECSSNYWNPSITNDQVCINSLTTSELGACRIPGNFDLEECNLVIGDQCEGNHEPGFLCSFFEDDNGCEPYSYVGCLEGYDEIFWYDSCNNLENVYQGNTVSKKDLAWNGGKLKSPDEITCTPDPNGNSCGDCGIESGTTCAEWKIGQANVGRIGGYEGHEDYTCRDTSCYEAPVNGYDKNNEVDFSTATKKSGTSWCLFEGFIGYGKDTVGSEHWVASCDDGEVSFKSSTQRDKVCVELEERPSLILNLDDDTLHFSGSSSAGDDILHLPDDEGDEGFWDEDWPNLSPDEGGLFAELITNDFASCYEIQIEYDGDERFEKCEENKFCAWVASRCVAAYPMGFAFWTEEEGNEDWEIAKCGGKNDEMSEEEGRFLGGQQNERNTQVKWVLAWNNHCISLGDCGAYLNYNGDWSEKGGFASQGGTKKYPGHKGKIDYTNYYPWGNYESMIFSEYETPINFANSNSLQSVKSYETNYEGYGRCNDLNAACRSNCNDGADDELLYVCLNQCTIEQTSCLADLDVSDNVTGGVGDMFSGGEHDETNFNCKLWQPLEDSKNCEKCMDKPFEYCSEYKCMSLGNCKYLEQGKDEEEVMDAEGNLNMEIVYSDRPLCVSACGGDLEAPEFVGEPKIIKPQQVSLDGEIEDGFNVYSATEYWDIFHPEDILKFEIETDVPSECIWRLGTEKPIMGGNIPWDNMEEDEDYAYFYSTGNKYTHTFMEELPYNEEILGGHSPEPDVNGIKTTKVYISYRCRSHCEGLNVMVQDEAIKFKLTSGPDKTPVRFEEFSPESGSYTKYKVLPPYEKEINFWINEPAECRYSQTQYKMYEEMDGQDINCDPIFDNTANYKCSVTLKNLVEDDNIFYFKCNDKPDADPENRVTNRQDYPIEGYVIHKSQGPLKVDSVSPSGDWFVSSIWGGEGFDLRAITSGGFEGQGYSHCDYKLNGRGNDWQPIDREYEEAKVEHVITDFLPGAGNRNIKIRCEDIAGNVATGETNINVIVDRDYPIVVRAYEYEGSLKIITNEVANCYYDYEGCNYRINETTSKMEGIFFEHTTSWNAEETYYIKCKDGFENKPSGCSMIVRPNFG